MSKPVVHASAVSNLVFKQVHFLSGGDEDNFAPLKKDYVILLAKGKVLLSSKDKTQEHCAPQILYVNAYKEVTVKATTNNTVLYVVIPLKIDPDLGFVGYENSDKTYQLLESINNVVYKDEHN